MNNLVNGNIVRWVYASGAKHFSAIAARKGIPIYIEGDNRNTHDLSEYVEFRMDGPLIQIPAKGERYEFFDINVLASITQGRNLYRPQEVVGAIASGMTLTIPIYKLGDESQDDGSKIGCLKFRRELDQNIEINQFGIVRPDTNIIQHTVEGHYRLVLELVLCSVNVTSSAVMTADLTVTP
jgi:hypothetical protein